MDVEARHGRGKDIGLEKSVTVVTLDAVRERKG
jgi:hypothetical protein